MATRLFSLRRGAPIALAVCLAFVASVTDGGGTVAARSADAAPPLPPPVGRVVRVSNERQLQAAVRNLTSNTTIMLAPGTYELTAPVTVSGALRNVTIRGAGASRDDVVLLGRGMRAADAGGVPFGVWTGGGVDGITIANLTIRDFFYHPIIFNAGTQRPHVYNVHLIDAGQQFIKSNPTPAGGGVNDGIVEYSLMEYVTTAKSDYTNGVDVHTGANWIIRHNLFRNITSRVGLAGPAILMWNHSSNTLAEGNAFVNCARGIAFGLEVKPGNDHRGGIIRNNVFYRSAAQPGDVAILVADSPGTQVIHNTVFVSGTYGTPIEYRFGSTTNVIVANNLLDGVIARRNNASADERGNLTRATADMFVDAAAGNLHLAPGALGAIDRGVAVGGVTDDWDGDPRPRGAGPDIGADERP